MTHKNHQLIIFDWDGTLMDSLSLIISSFQYAAEQLNLPIPEADEVRVLIGLGLPEAVKAAFGESTLDDQQMQAFRAHYGQVYVSESVQGQALYTGARDLLENLVDSGFELAVATGKSRAGLERALDQSNTRSLFKYTRCADETQSKPDPQMLHEILSDSGVRAEQSLMVGDTHFDMEMAKAAAVKPIAVSYGAQTQAMLERSQPDYIADSMIDLKDWFENVMIVRA